MSSLQRFKDAFQITKQYYEQHADRFYQDTVELNLEHLYAPFLQLLSPGSHILDAGCGSGRDSLYFRNAGFQVTAFDVSQRMVELSSELLGQPVLLLSFQELCFQEQFDGIWACASLLHVPRGEMHDVWVRLSTALRPNGVLFASFKHGDREEFRNGRYFNNYDETSFAKLIDSLPTLEIVSLSTTIDVRQNRTNEVWLNALVQKYA